MRPLLARTLGDDVVLTTRADPGIWPVRIDVVQLEQVFLNLAANARDAMPNGGRFTIAVENVVIKPPDDGDGGARRGSRHARAPFVQLRFTDTGAGMTAAVLERIFEPFYTTKDAGKGTGLGLAAVYGIVRQSGGYIEARSKPGQGSELRLLLPRAGRRRARLQAERGSRTVNVEPTPTSLSTVIVPLEASTICFAIQRPRPRPG